uniref:Uncharacterized protein n=1 Tax=Timema poppense TaxID=170557 RepID=A0A7R9D1M0_TIMPO|nr:unnamed protein product [Timema poppensis]
MSLDQNYSSSPLLVRTSGGAHVLAHALITVQVSTGALKWLTTLKERPGPAGPEHQPLDPITVPTPSLVSD